MYVLDLPEVLFIVLQSNNSIEFYTTRVLSNGPFNTELVPISPPNYFPDKFESLDGIPVRFHTVMYPPYSYYERTVCYNQVNTQINQRSM